MTGVLVPLDGLYDEFMAVARHKMRAVKFIFDEL